jgi:hypothetical protein
MKNERTETATVQDVVKILMLSPIYFMLTMPQRLVLVKEYCQAMRAAGL